MHPRLFFLILYTTYNLRYGVSNNQLWTVGLTSISTVKAEPISGAISII